MDQDIMRRTAWKYLIVDEGHTLKNKECKLFSALKAIGSENRVLLTGTPIQNTLEELWSLLNFVNPEIFDDLRIFQTYFGFKGKAGSDALGEAVHSDVVAKLHDVLRPFLLRRL